MLIRPLMSFALAASIGCLFAPQADANSRFTVENQTDQKFWVYIYRGDDNSCTYTEKTKTVSGGETDSYGCTGGGKNRCKVGIVFKKKYTVCNTMYNTCNGYAVKADNGAKITIVDDVFEEYACTLD
ncbi:MAG: hypothetical protein AAFY82_08985 [Pseudomonadota bacterium]